MAFNKCQCKCKLNIHKNMSAKKVVFGILCVCVRVAEGGTFGTYLRDTDQ